jgi:filamentous hemagglutinin
LGSTLSGNTINLQSGGNANIVGSNIHGSGSVQMTAGGNLNILASSNTLAQERSSQTSAGLMGNSGKSSDSMTQTTAASSTITGGNIQMQSGSDTTLQATHITGNSLAISAGTINGQTINPNAKLNIDAAIQSQSKTHTSSGSDLMTQNSSNSGKISQSLNYSTINLQDAHGNTQSPTFNATGGITVGASNLPSNGASTAASTAANATTGGSAPPTITIDLKQQASQLSNQPGLSYLGELTKRNDTTFEKVQLASQSWDYSQSGLSQSGAIIVAIAVAAASAGAASGFSTTLVAGAGLTGTTATVASAALAAGMTSLATQAAISLANNQGDLGKTLQDLGSDSAVKNTLAAMVTAGALAGLGNVTTFTGQSGAESLTNSTSGIATNQALNEFTNNLVKNLQNNLTGTVINSAITGNPLNEASLTSALTSALITASTAQGANSIGDATQSGTLNTYTQAIAHAIAGCAGGAAAAGNGGGCGAGAVGAVVGELTAQYASNTGMTDPAAITALARVMSATAGLLVSGGDATAVNAAASMGANAAQNNRMQHMNSFKAELAACQSNAGGNGCGTTLQMVQGTTPVSAGTNLNGYNAAANVNASGTAMSYVISDAAGNQLIMQPLEYQNFQKMNPVQQQSLMNASQASLDASSAGQYLSAGQIGAAASNFAHLNNQSSLGPVIDQARTNIAGAAAITSRGAGVVASSAQAVAAVTLVPAPLVAAGAESLAGAAAGVGFLTTVVEQVARPNVGAATINTVVDVAVGAVSKWSPVASPAFNELGEAIKNSSPAQQGGAKINQDLNSTTQ